MIRCLFSVFLISLLLYKPVKFTLGSLISWLAASTLVASRSRMFKTSTTVQARLGAANSSIVQAGLAFEFNFFKSYSHCNSTFSIHRNRNIINFEVIQTAIETSSLVLVVAKIQDIVIIVQSIIYSCKITDKTKIFAVIFCLLIIQTTLGLYYQ